MAGTTSRINFAVIGHQDTWQKIEKFINGIRASKQVELPVNKIKDIYPFIPPRVLFRVNVKSTTGSEINGVYIDTFIDPDKLDPQFTKTNIRKVIQAATCAEKEGAGITTLGGFTSIVQEGNFDSFPKNGTKFTTGNTLTAAYVVKGVEVAASRLKINLGKAKVMILGATGDMGMACVQYFKGQVKEFLLCARNMQRLKSLAQNLSNAQVPCQFSTSSEDMLPEADIVICVASAVGLNFTQCKKNVLICDAGYPKNLDPKIMDMPGVHLFHGGMGQVKMGYQFSPDYSGSIYSYPAPGIAHGCILEAMVLAFENKLENYSSGKGNITRDKIEEIYACGLKHGITLAPLHNSNGCWPASH